MGKFDTVAKKLPRLPPEIRYSDQGGITHQQKVDEEKAKLTEREPEILLRQYAEARKNAEDKEQEAKDLRVVVNAYEQLLIDAFEGRGIDSIKLSGIGTMRIDPTPHTQVVDRMAYRQWCIDNGFEEQMQLPWGTTNATMKEKLLSGEEIPECVTIYNKPTPVFTREKS